MKIIALDSSGLVASVAVVEDDNLIAEYNVQYKKTHSQTLLPMLDEIKRMVSLELDSIDAVAISRGPGSFTGLRIGSATAKGLCQALDKPIVEIGSLEGMACNLYSSSEIICPMMDARRSQVYTGAFTYEYKDGSYQMKTLLPECALGIEELMEKLNDMAFDMKKRIILLGDAVPVYETLVREKLKADFSFAPSHMNRQRASAFSYLALEKLRRGEFVDYREHAPEYLRLSQAERERNEGIRNKGSNY